MYISKKKTSKILACAMSALLVSSFSGVASAEDEIESSDNTVEVTETADTINDELITNHADTVADEGNTEENPTDNSNNSTITRTNEASDNEVTIDGTNTKTNGATSTRVDGSRVDAGGNDSFQGDANNNKLTINSGNFSSFVNGGRANIGNTNYNLVTINGGTFGSWVEGGWATKGNANYNTVVINGGTFNYIIDGGYTGTGDANYNTVTINDGIINHSVFGGYVASSGEAIGNVINIHGGTFGDESKKVLIYSGTGTTVKDNVVNIYDNPNLTNASIYAARGGNSSGNSINFYTKDIVAQDIGGFEKLNFYLPANTVNGNTVLTLMNPISSISDNINVYRDGNNSLLRTGDKVTLITTPSASGLKLTNNITDGTIDQGISLEYPINFNRVLNGSGNVVSLEAVIGDTQPKLKEQTNLLTSAVVDTASALDSGTDRLLEWLPPEGFNDINSMPTTAFDPFVGIGGSSYKVDTGNGTRMKTQNGGINFGMARYLKNRHGTFIFAPVTDYGYDHYESTLDDANRTEGHGDTKYFTAGFICRQVSTHGMYYETSLRYGRVRTNFLSNNFLVHNVPTTASYSASTPCYCGHVRIGWRDHVSPQNILDVYGVYSLNHVKGFTTTVSTGENYSFSAVKSGRMRIGARLTREVKEKQNFYSELAYIHEFTGETQGEYMGMSTKKSGLKGNIGLIELGWQMKPTKNSMTMVDAALSCWLGDKKGVQFAVKLKRDF